MYEVSAGLNRRLTNRLKGIIRRQQLIDTGRLYSSIKVNAFVDNLGGITLRVEGMYYLVYLWESQNLDYIFQFGRGFEDYVSDILQEWTDHMIRKEPNLAGFQEVLKRVNAFIKVEIIQLYTAPF